MGIYKKHVTATNFSETTISDKMKFKTLPDGSVWARINWLDVTKDKTPFANDAEVADCIKSNRFSKMGIVDKLATSQVELTNLAPEINGTTGFSTGSAKTNEQWHPYSDASFQLTGTTASEMTAQSSAATVPLVNGHIYYARVEVKQPTVHGSAEMFLGGSAVGGGVAAPPIITAQSVSNANTWTKISGVAVRNFPTGNHKFRLDYNNSGTSGYTMCFDGLIIIDLTEAFGVGEEPTKAWCDANIPYFRGTITLDASNAAYKRWEFLLNYPNTKNEEYVLLDYIASSGTQYIDTGLKTNQDTKIEIDASYTANYSLYGAGKAWTNFTAGGAGGYFYYNDYGPGSSTPGPYANMRHFFVQDKNKCFIDKKIIHTFAYTSFTSPGNLFLFGRNDGAGALNDAGGTVKIYSCKIYNNGVLVRNFVPCKNSAGTVGLLDKVNKTFYANKGSGSFTAGNAVKSFTLDLHNRWIQTISPNSNYVTSTDGTGYKAITTAWTSYAAPITKSASSGSSLYSCNLGGNWWAPIGQKTIFNSVGIPAADGSTQTETELWVRIDNLSSATKAQIFKDNSMISPYFYEY